jgi:hypothetical protein
MVRDIKTGGANFAQPPLPAVAALAANLPIVLRQLGICAAGGDWRWTTNALKPHHQGS